MPQSPSESSLASSKNRTVPLPEYVLLAKQAIYCENKDLFAYELLFRSPLNLGAIDLGGDLATSQVLVNYCASVSQQAEAINQPVFINVGASYIKHHDMLPVSVERVVIEVNDYEPDDAVLLESIDRWREQGFCFSIDDVDVHAPPEALLAKADFAKVDVQDIDWPALAAALPALQRKGLIWIAKRIEDEQSFERSVRCGFSRFQGYFLARPKQISGNSIRPGTAVTIRLISALDQPRITMDHIAQLVSQEPKLAMQMLKIINSPLFSLPKQVDDLKSALVYLGVDMLRQWAMMIAFLSNGNVHVEASRYVLQRAKTMELIAKREAQDADLAPKAFLAGLVSGVDVLLNIKPSQFLEQVQLSSVIGDAVMQRKAPLGPTLQTVVELERAVAQGDNMLAFQEANNLNLYAEADQWVNQVFDALKATV